jgi:hypothetical protein
MIRNVAIIIAVAFLLGGIIGFVEAPRGGLLLGTFAVDEMHNIIHLASGALGLIAVALGRSKLYLQAIGVIYLLVGILGLIPGAMNRGMLLGLFHVNSADSILHLVVGGVAAFFGFLYRTRALAGIVRPSHFS